MILQVPISYNLREFSEHNMIKRFSIILIQFINLHSCLNDLLTLYCLIIHNKIHKLIKIRKYFHGIWIECLKIRWYSLPYGLFFCINLLHCLRYSLLYSLDRFNFFLFPFFPLKFFLGGRFFPHHNFLKHFLIVVDQSTQRFHHYFQSFIHENVDF